MGNGGCGQFITHCLYRSFLLTLPLLQREVPLTGDSSSQTSPVWSFPRAAALHKLPQRGSLPRGAVLQEQAAPAWVPHGVTRPASKPAPARARLSMSPQVLAGACSSTGLPMGSQPPLAIHLLRREVPPTGYRWIPAPLWTSMGCSRTACLTIVCSTGCRGISAPATGAPPPTPLAFVSAELFLSCILSPLF